MLLIFVRHSTLFLPKLKYIAELIYTFIHKYISWISEEIIFIQFVNEQFISGVRVSMLASSAVDRGFIGGVTVSMLALSAVDRGFESRLGRTRHSYYNKVW
jgi:hypothetical protein